jgi:uncharacterized surface protein with fasciclin (FAS1) repeats
MHRKMLIVLMALAVLTTVALPAAAQTATRTGMPGQAPMMISALQSRPELSQFTNALAQSDLYNIINRGGEYTIFAPTDDAFGRLPQERANVMRQSKYGMDYILGYHVVRDKMSPQLLRITDSLMTLDGSPVSVSMAGNDIMVDGARIIGNGFDTGNVVIYPVNTVMIPPYQI